MYYILYHNSFTITRIKFNYKLCFLQKFSYNEHPILRLLIIYKHNFNFFIFLLEYI